MSNFESLIGGTFEPPPEHVTPPPEPLPDTPAARELEKRLLLLAELCRVAEERAVHHASKALLHAGHWTGDWQFEKSQRLHELARILGDPSFHAAVRHTPSLRAMFSANVPPPLPKRPRSKHTRRRKPVKTFNPLDVATWGLGDDALGILAKMKDAGIALHMIDLGGDTTTNGVSKLVFTILSAVAEAERDRTRERIAEVKADQRKRGRYLGGIVPFGFTRGEDGARVRIPELQAAIRKMRKLHGQGLALRPIAEAMRAEGVAISHMGVQAVLAEGEGA